MSIKNEYPKGISQNSQRSFIIFVNKIDIVEDVQTASPNAAEKMANMDNEAKTTTVWSCALPIPNSMRDAQSHNWGTQQGAVSKGVNALLDGASSLAVGGAAGKMAGSKNKLLSAAGRSTDSKFNVASLVKEVSHRMGNRQPTVNPMYWQEYTGTDPRTFSFLWDLIPSSKEESDQILTILRKIKQYTSPQLTALELGLLSPYTFDIQIANGHINEIMKLKGVAVRSVDIDYAVDGAVQFHHDGTPKHMTLSLQFVELRTTTSEDYDGSDGPSNHIDSALVSTNKWVTEAYDSGLNKAKELFN